MLNKLLVLSFLNLIILNIFCTIYLPISQLLHP